MLPVFYFVTHLVVSVLGPSLLAPVSLPPVWLPAPPWCVSPVSHCFTSLCALVHLPHPPCQFILACLTLQWIPRVLSVFWLPDVFPRFFDALACLPVLEWLPVYPNPFWIKVCLLWDLCPAFWVHPHFGPDILVDHCNTLPNSPLFMSSLCGFTTVQDPVMKLYSCVVEIKMKVEFKDEYSWNNAVMTAEWSLFRMGICWQCGRWCNPMSKWSVVT